jgi:tetratricopeptide (TPR) repeat protein
MTIAPQKPTVSADTIYSSVIGDYANVTQTIVSQPRKPSLFQLPTDDPNFTGRSDAIQAIEAILTSEKPTALISAVSGMGGVGKSVLATHMGHLLKGQYPDGQLYVDLRGQSESPRDPIAVLIDFLVYGFGLEAQQLPFELDGLRGVYLSQLNGKKILVVLDNAKDAGQVETLLPGMGCGALVTSREKLTGLAGVTAESFVPIDIMPIDEAIALLNRLCPEKTRDVALTTTLATLCGRLPLALTIVGRLLFGTVSLTLAKLTQELGEERSRLRSLKVRNTRDEIEAKLDVEASFNLSYKRLLPEQQQVFVAASVLRGVDFGVALAAVLGEMDEALVQRRLDQLVTLALVQMPEGKDDRYCFHDLMREFGRGKLEPEREAELGMKALGWYDDNANGFDDCLSPTSRRPIAEGLVSEWEQPLEIIESELDAMAMEWFLAEHRNLVGAVNWAQNLSEHQMVVRLTTTLVTFFQRRSFWNDWLTTHQVALKSAREISDHPGIANTMNNLGSVYRARGEWDKAIDCCQQSLEIYGDIGNQSGIAKTINNLGNVYQFKGKWDEAIDCYQQSLEIYGDIGDIHGIAQTMTNLGLVYQSQGKWDEAINCYQQSLEISRDIGDIHGIAQTMTSFGLVYNSQGKWNEAIDSYQQSLEILCVIGNQRCIALTIGNLGVVYKNQGKWDEAIDCYQQSLEIYGDIGDIHSIALTIGNLGVVYKKQRKWDEAIDCYQQSIQSSRQIGDPESEANGWYNLGNIQSELGQPAARTSYQNAKALCQQLKLTDKVQNCDNAIATIDNPRKKKRSFPLWQSAIVLLLLGIGWMAMKPQAPAQNGEVRISK